MRTPLVVANWKMNLPPEGMGSYLDAVRAVSGVVIAPPFPYVRDVARKLPCVTAKAGAHRQQCMAAR